MTELLLDVRDLVTTFEGDAGPVRVVDGLSLSLPRGGTLGIVGESGCGKSVTSLSIMGLLPRPAARVASGSILLSGRSLLDADESELRKLRGNRMAMIFQEPMTSLNPVYTVGEQIMEAVILHQRLDRAAARDRAIHMLETVGIPSPERRVDAYPHELSGGMRQRVMIAIAISCEPDLLIADEPTTALDVTIQAQVLELLRRLQRDRAMGIVLITHDLGVVAQFVDEVLVMYAGRAVERAPTTELFERPRHPYTRGLLASVPGFAEPASRHDGKRRLATIEGVVPDLARLPAGCAFRERCVEAIDRCATERPALQPVGGVQVACFVASERGAA